jgi:hypothetical protein
LQLVNNYYGINGDTINNSHPIYFIYSSYSLATIRLWWRLHILITKLVLWLLPQVPTRMYPRVVIHFRGIVPHCYPCLCSISHLLFPEPCLLRGYLTRLSSISSSLPLLFLVLFPTFVSSTVHTSIRKHKEIRKKIPVNKRKH